MAEGLQGVLRIGLRLCLNQMLMLLSFVVPRRQGFLVLGAGLGRRFMGNPKYVYLELLRRRQQQPELTFCWITENRQLQADFEARGWPVVNKFSLRGFITLLRADFLVIESGMVAKEVLHDVAYAWLFLGRFRVIQTWHGSPMKRICLDALRDRGVNTPVERLFFALNSLEYRSYDCVIAQSDYDREILLGAFGNPNVPVLGCARNDILLSHEHSPADPITKLGLEGFDRVILYAPTFRESRSEVLDSSVFSHRSTPLKPFSSAFLETLNAELLKRNWILLVKKHHLDTALTIQKNLTQIREVNDVDDIQELLVATDVLISDYSSVCFDFAQANRPIIYYVYDLEQYLSQARGFYIDFRARIPGPFAQTEEELLALIMDVGSWFDGGTYQTRFRAFREEFQRYSDGGATQRLLDYMKLRQHGLDPLAAAATVQRDNARE